MANRPFCETLWGLAGELPIAACEPAIGAADTMQGRLAGRAVLLKPLTGLSVPEVVSAAPLTIEPFLELDLRDWPGRVQVDPLAPHAPDPTPTPHKRQILEERRFDRQDVKSRHVLGAVDSFEHENLKKGRVGCVRVHGPKLRRKNSIASNE